MYDYTVKEDFIIKQKELLRVDECFVWALRLFQIYHADFVLRFLVYFGTLKLFMVVKMDLL